MLYTPPLATATELVVAHRLPGPLNGQTLIDAPVVLSEGSGPIDILRDAEDGARSKSRIASKGFWPCWSPDGSRIAYSTVDQDRGATRSAIALAGADGSDAGSAYDSPPGVEPVIAPRVPHYVNWSPNGDLLGFVAPAEESLGLFVSDTRGVSASDRIAGGAPLFWCWNPTGTAVAVHSGSTLLIHRVETHETTTLALEASGFRTPAFVDSGLLYTVARRPGVALMAIGDDPGPRGREVRRFGGGVTLQRRPGSSDDILVAVTEEPNTGVFHELWLVNAATGDGERIFRGPIVAAQWAPDGSRFAIWCPTQSGDGRYSVQARDAGGAYIAATEPVLPSQDQRTLLAFFDQYAQSHHSWSPASDSLLLCGRSSGEGTAWSFSDEQNDYAFSWRVEPGAALERLSVADIAFYGPADV